MHKIDSYLEELQTNVIVPPYVDNQQNDVVDDQQEEQNNVTKRDIIKQIKKEIKKIRTYIPKVAIFGDAGVGKSSLCNALFGKEVAKVSDVKVGTTEMQEIDLDSSDGGIVLLDFPGLGDGKNDYTKEYIDALENIDLIIWAIKADDRKYQIAVNFYKKYLEQYRDTRPIIFVITQVDKIEPYKEWDSENSRPSDNQEKNINEKIKDISETFDISTKYIVPVSANEGYNLVKLVSTIVKELPSEKKYSFARETKDENIDDETSTEAVKGIFDYLKEKFDDVIDSVKEIIVDHVSDMIREHTPKLLKKGLDFIKGKLTFL